jgi:tRNA nucleotidyltransferase (CCA-adding enzyme)
VLVEDYVRSLGLDAYLVGGAVRDELLGLESKDADFLVTGVDTDALRTALEPHGRVEDLVVADRLVGVRLHPRDKAVRALVPAGIEFAPPRREVSTGPGRHDFEIVADATLSVEEDMRRRDFTVNAMARRLSDGEIVDPLDGQGDLKRRLLRAVSDTSFAEDPLRLVRGLRFVSQLGFELDAGTREQMEAEAPAVRLVSGERIGGGLAADGMGELSKLLLGARPRAALEVARDTGVLDELIPEFGPAHYLADHTFAVVQQTADAGNELAIRLAALFHDLGKPVDAGPLAHAQVGADIARATMNRLRYPTRLTRRVVALVREHPYFPDDRPQTPRDARRFLLRYGDELAFDLVVFRRADLLAKDRDATDLDAVQALLDTEMSQPHRLSDLAVDGNDLLVIGFRAGPDVGRALQELLELVVDDPGMNTRQALLDHAKVAGWPASR